jgi:hypothetical protein
VRRRISSLSIWNILLIKGKVLKILIGVGSGKKGMRLVGF